VTKPSGIHYELIENGKKGRLLSNTTYNTQIVHKFISYDRGDFCCDLYRDGRLLVYRGSIWDFGTGSIDTPAMVYASLEHDALCKLTNARLLPWKYRFIADKGLWNTLGSKGATLSRLWRVPAVMIYSQLFARWKDKK